ncbi:short-chain dehydrogenase, partial [Acinetobacter baumannii]
LLADWNAQTLAKAAADLASASYAVETQPVDVASREAVRALAERAAALGPVMQVVNTAGRSPNMAPVEKVLEVDLYGAAVVFEEFG